MPPPPPANHINVANQFSVANQFAAAANQYAGAPNGSVPPMLDGPSAAAAAAASTGATPPGHKPNDATCIGCVAERLIATTRCELAASRDWCRRYCDYRSHGTSQESLALFHEDRQRLAHIERVLGLGQAAWDIKSIETLQGVRDSSSLAQALLTVMGLLVARVDALEKEKMKLEQEKLSTAVAQSARDRQMQDFAAMLQSTREELRLARVKTGELEGRILRMEAHSRGGAPAPAYPLFTDKRPHSAMAATTTAPSHPQSMVVPNGNSNGESANTNGSHNAAATAKRPAASEEERTTGDTPQPPRKRIALCPPLLTVPLPPASTSSVLSTNGHPRSAGEAPTTRNPIIASPGPPLLPASFSLEQAASHLAQLRKQIRTPASFLRHTKVSDDEPVSRELQRPQSVPPIMALPRPQQQQQPVLPVTPTRLTSSRLASTPAPSAISRAVSPSPLKVGHLPTVKAAAASKEAEAPTANELASNHPTSSSVQVGPFPQPSEKEGGHHEGGQQGQELQAQERPQSPSSRLVAAAAAKAAGGDGESNGNGSHKGAKGKAKAAAATEARVEGSIERSAPQKRSSLAL